MVGWNCVFDECIDAYDKQTSLCNKSTCTVYCGDGATGKDSKETCDDGNTIDKDGCSSTCQVEVGHECLYDDDLMRSVCDPLCGNFQNDSTDLYTEHCDNGNNSGCINCVVDPHYTCSDFTSCTPLCGDGVTVPPEKCDISIPIQGCLTCQLVHGWTCPNSTYCHPICGDNILIPPETCDDRNAQNGDGCSSLCTVETGYSCSPMPCHTKCGDGLRIPPEECDTGGNTAGCNFCHINPGWNCTCQFQNEWCINTTCFASRCGDEIRAGTEECDFDSPACINCTLNPLYTCASVSAPKRQAPPPNSNMTCEPKCGDGIVVEPEMCDFTYTVPGCEDCNFQSGWNCNSTSCYEKCGDGIKVGKEECDTGPVMDGGCVNCRIAQGWNCTNTSQCYPICGDGLLKGNEICDDNNTVDGDGCSSNCTLEAGYICPNPGKECLPKCGDSKIIPPETCDTGTKFVLGCTNCILEHGYTCSDQSCTTVCGDGLVNGTEQCDDNNTDPNDGCDGCKTTPFWDCTNITVSPTICHPICGQGGQQRGEECDDGNTISGDGCSTCRQEIGWTCAVTCTPNCGDRLVKGSEACDSTTGCSDVCAALPGYNCTSDLNLCTTICGDAFIAGNEDCDEGILKSEGCKNCKTATYWQCGRPGTTCTPVCSNGHVDGDETCDSPPATPEACNKYCRTNTGWECTNNTCHPICGDGLKLGDEACDDSNNITNDGCSYPDCQIDRGWTCDPICTTNCGDGLIAGSEECDIHDIASEFACYDNCTLFHGWNCTYSPTLCHTTCGDSYLASNSSEQCDDGNSESKDGCNSTCQTERGYKCPREGSPCFGVCGDGIVTVGESCDAKPPGCTDRCLTVSGWKCTEGQPCTEICGDSLIVGNETCDDGNSEPDDGCDSNCHLMTGWNCSKSGLPCTCIFGDWSEWGSTCLSCSDNGIMIKTRRQSKLVPDALCSNISLTISTQTCVYPCPSAAITQQTIIPVIFNAFSNSYFTSHYGITPLNYANRKDNSTVQIFIGYDTAEVLKTKILTNGNYTQNKVGMKEHIMNLLPFLTFLDFVESKFEGDVNGTYFDVVFTTNGTEVAALMGILTQVSLYIPVFGRIIPMNLSAFGLKRVQTEQSRFTMQIAPDGPNCTVNSTNQVLLALSDLLPQMDPSQITILMSNELFNCSYSVIVEPDPTSFSLGAIVAAVIGAVAGLMSACLLYYLFRRRYTRSFLDLPPEIASHYDQYSTEKNKWEPILENAPAVRKQLQPDSEDILKFEELFCNHLHGSKMLNTGGIETVWAVNSPPIVTSFSNYKVLMESRLRTSRELFASTSWVLIDEDGLKSFVFRKFEEYVNSLPWCKGETVPIIPTVHGCDLNVAWKICNNGFVALSLLDKGYYGKGIYFTTYALYASPYFRERHNPSILISYVVPGNIFPVTEHQTSPESLVGTAIKSGYNSHYVLTQKNGTPLKKRTTRFYDELVIGQEAQICPAYVVKLKSATIGQVANDFERETPDRVGEVGVDGGDEVLSNANGDPYEEKHKRKRKKEKASRPTKI
eukprot:TRINITY_DN3202_c0_g1_i12.p1 TRINITY_DN3202_c0_g1~~TRINITY_DN3202_c0_g1_i12.p1  ORF type:complete len:1533 (-),score=260.60 TRINITY_DN3202_c0_g1_i12:146-4744(-)